MKPTKLIPKHQIGQKIWNTLLSGLQYFGNALIAGDSGVGTATAIASGYRHNPKTGKWEQSEENIALAEGLRNNLAVLSTFSPTHLGTALLEKAVVPGVVAASKQLVPKQLVSKILYSPNPKSLYLRYAVGKFKFGFDAKLPDLIRRTKNPMPKVNVHRAKSNIFVSPLENRFRFKNTGEPSPVITNFSTDLPVIPNSGGSWSGLNINIIKDRNLLGKNVISTKPQDTFTYGDKITVPKKDIITISSKLGTVPEEKMMEQFFQVYKRPTLKDYQFMDYVFQPKYKSGVFPTKPIETPDHPLFKYFWDADMRNRLNQPWGEVMYDIAPTVEHLFRKDMGIVLRSQVPTNTLIQNSLK